ncbi:MULTISPECIES: iron-containing redox enzyme family protein [unclassified Duganella]|uniref:iron-containing redox enzyme family protein n=1 Tax=unclassified Duganella TaxID=2636909 RepID=UPI0013149C74|nr:MULTISPECIES: iron-containing redox enzyme family protein [unclassified Duganella]
MSAAIHRKIQLCGYGRSLDNTERMGVEQYRDYLCQLHQVVRASIPLMELAVQRCDASHPVESQLIAYLTEHIEEERGHAELLVRDLEAAGMPEAQLLLRVPDAAIAELVGAQYYWITHYSPLALLGYISFLEGRPPTEQAIAFWQTATGLPDAAFHSLRLHSEADPGHWQALDDFLDTLDLSAAEVELIGLSAMQSAQRAGAAWSGLVQRWSH